MKRTWYKQGTALLKEIEQTTVPENDLTVWYLGQCSFVFKHTATVYIDPMLNDLAEDGASLRLYPAPFAPSEVRADYVLCTHNHADHLALETLQGIASHDPDTKFLVPSGCISALTDMDIAPHRVIGVQAHAPVELPGLTVTAVSAAHPVHQTDTQGRDLALCYSLHMGGLDILHLGDTYLTDQLLADLQTLPTPQLFFPPVNGSDYFRTKRNCIGNLNPLEAARLSQILHADLTIPTHFDMIRDNTVDPLDFVRALWEIKPDAKWHIPALGERFVYRK